MIDRFAVRWFYLVGFTRVAMSTFEIYLCQSLLILLFILLCSYGFHKYTAGGFLVNRDLVARIQDAHLTHILPRIDATDIPRMIQRRALIVDARYRSDYEAGHLPGAINIPVNEPESIQDRKLNDVPKDWPIVIYCQSQGCQFDDIIARILHADGFTNLYLFSGGWLEWRAVTRE